MTFDFVSTVTEEFSAIFQLIWHVKSNEISLQKYIGKKIIHKIQCNVCWTLPSQDMLQNELHRRREEYTTNNGSRIQHKIGNG